MKAPPLSRNRQAATQQPARVRQALILLAFTALTFGSGSARAVDGCQLLLCLAAPSWRSIPQCVPTVTQALLNLARGKPFPSCSMTGAGNTAGHAWAKASSFCPIQYTRIYETESGPVHTCGYAGAITATVDGEPFSRTWWAMDGSTSTEFSPTAKAQLRGWNTRFDVDHAAWLNAQTPSATLAPSY